VSDRVPGGEDMPRRWPAGGREGAVARLMALDSRGELATEHARAVAGSLGVSLRTVWNWVAVARREDCPHGLPSRAGVTPDMRVRLAVWGGNVSAVHRELLAEAAAAGDPGSVPSLRTLQRAVRRDLSAGERAGLKGGEAARRRYDV
jgi:putative transposase